MEQKTKSELFYETRTINKEQEEWIADLKKHGISDLMARLYVLRGVKDYQEANLIQKLENFKGLKNIEKATRILREMIKEKKKICVVADYDVDGATACTIAVAGLRMFGADIDYVVPDRFIHGYGLTPSVVDEAIEKTKPDLIITVDNGIASFDGVKYAHEKGIKVLVTDHHLQGDSIPEADCIVNPNQKSCTFKSKSLAGCGVIFYVLAALRQFMIEEGEYHKDNAPPVFSLLDLVAIGTVADVVKLDLNNRILVQLGLNLIHQKKTRPGVLALIQVANKKYQQLGTVDIGFGLGPRINAAGRLKDMTIGINCLLTSDWNVAEKLANQLNEINKERKDIETSMKEMVFDFTSIGKYQNTKVAYDFSFHEGVIGIVASRIKEFYYRPTIVFADTYEKNEYIKGSGRSIPEVHLKDVLDYIHKKRDDIIVKFGGHAMAAGLTIKKDKLSEFEALFEEAVVYFTEGKELLNIKQVDFELTPEELTLETAKEIRQGIWGQGFNQPLFKGEFEILEQRILKEAHLKLKIRKEGMEIDAIWFFHKEKLQENKVNFVYSLDLNEFRGQSSLQLLIDGIYN